MLNGQRTTENGRRPQCATARRFGPGGGGGFSTSTATCPPAAVPLEGSMNEAEALIVRRIFEHMGYEVKKLDRVVFAGLTKKDLPRGRSRFLTAMEIANLKIIPARASFRRRRPQDSAKASAHGASRSRSTTSCGPPSSSGPPSNSCAGRSASGTTSYSASPRTTAA